MKRVMLMTKEELEATPKLTLPYPSVFSVHYQYTNTEGETFIITKRHGDSYHGCIESIPVHLVED